MHTISIFVDQNRMPKLASYFECQTHLAKNLRNSANFILRNLRTGLKKDPVDRTSNENEVIETVRIGIEMANEKLQKDVDRLTKQLQSLPASDPARTKIQKRIDNKQKNHPHSESYLPLTRIVLVRSASRKTDISNSHLLCRQESDLCRSGLLWTYTIPLFQ